MREFDTDQAENIGADLAGLIGALFENVVSAQNLGLPQYEDILERIAELGKQAEEHLEKYRRWQDGKEPEPAAPAVMPTETSPREILEQIAPLLDYGVVAANLIVNKYAIQNHMYDSEARLILTITWREFNELEHAEEVYNTLNKIKGISRVEWEYYRH